MVVLKGNSTPSDIQIISTSSIATMSKWVIINDFTNCLVIYVFGNLAEALPTISLSIMQPQYVNGVLFYKLNDSLYYMISYVDGYLLNQ